MNNIIQEKRLRTVKQVAKEEPAFPVGGLRNLMFHNTDGFRDECVIKIGAKVLIDTNAMGRWIDAHREAA